MTAQQTKIALVTGGGSGIGRATALAFAREGATVVVADVEEETGGETVDMIDREDGNAIFVQVDVSQPDQVKAMFRTIIDTYGRLDYAFNNAGIEGEAATTAECSQENWDRVININLRGIWLCMKYEIAQMLDQGGGAIVNTSSVAGQVGFPSLPAYTASKHGILGLTKTAALEYATQGIRVNAVCPGVIDTAMIDRFTQESGESVDELASSEPVGRMGRPAEVADAVVWLCSDAASFVTGHAIAVDGGWLAQ